jgi:hypothetical protein
MPSPFNKHTYLRMVIVGCAICACAASGATVQAQINGNEDVAQRRARLEHVQAQLREEIRQKTQVLYSVSLAQTQDEAAYRRQESQLVSLRSQEGEVQRLLIKAEMKVIEAGIKVEVCPEAAPDKRVVQAELKIAEAQRRYLGEKLDAVHRSMDQCLDQLKTRTADLDGRRTEIEQLQAKEQRVTAELSKLSSSAAPARSASTIAAQ